MTQYLSNFTQKFEPTDTLIDPVSKFRVSQPQNLTDTDFEYGLQDSKWETLERVNNIPTFFSRFGDESLPIQEITAIQGSDRVAVTCTSDHNLIVGSPIIVSGLTSNSAEGAAVVVRIISSTSFEYSAKRTQSFPGLSNGATFSIKLDESSITAGKLYQGTQYKLENLDLIQTDGEDPSQLTVQTNSPHGFNVGTKFILSNTVGGKTFKFDASLIQPDTVQTEVSDTRLTERVNDTNLYDSYAVNNYDWQGRYGVFVPAANVNIFENTIYAPNHNFVQGDLLVYISPRTEKGALAATVDYAIGGLTNYTPYWVVYVDQDTFALSSTEIAYQSGTNPAYVSLTHPGVTDHAPHHFAKGYRISASAVAEQTLAFVNRDIENGQECVLISTGTGLAGVNRSLNNYNSANWTKYFYQNTTNQTGTGYGVVTFASSGINISTDNITPIEASLAALDFKTGDHVRFYRGSGTLPAGITDGTTYWVRVETDTSFGLYTTRATAIAGGTTSKVNFTTQGTGTNHKIEKTRAFFRFALTSALTTFATTTTAAPTGTTVVVPIIDLSATTRDTIYIEDHGFQTSDVVLVSDEVDTSGVLRERSTPLAAINDGSKLGFEGTATSIDSATSRFTPFTAGTTETMARFQTGTRVRYQVQPDFAFFQCSNVVLATDVITTVGDTRYNTLRSFKTGEAVKLEVFPEPITFSLAAITNPDADTTLFNTGGAAGSTKLYENALGTANPVEVIYRAASTVGYAAPANTSAGRELIDGNTYWFRAGTLPTFALYTTKEGAIAQTAAARVRPVTTGNGIGTIVATKPLPEGLSTDPTYYIRVGSNTTFTLHTTSEGAIAGTDRVDITNLGPGTRARVVQQAPTALAGLTAGSDYYLRNITSTTFEFYTTRNQALTTASTTGKILVTAAPALNAGNGFHQFNVLEPVQTIGGRSGTSGSLITVPDANIYVVGQQILYTNNADNSATPIQGMNFGGKYFVRPVSATTVSIHTSASGAIANTQFVVISSSGGGLFISSPGIASVGETSYVVENVSADRIRLRESLSASIGQPLIMNPHLSGKLTLTKRTPVENSETVFINQHGLSQGTELLYNSATFDPVPIFSEFNNGYTITTLTNNEPYYVTNPSQNRFRLSSTPNTDVYNITASSGTVSNISYTITTPTFHALRTGDKVVYESVNPITGLNSGSMYYALRMNTNVLSFASTGWNATTNILTATHAFGADGTVVPVIYRTAPSQGSTSTGTVAGGLVAEKLYWARTLSSTTLSLFNSAADANANTNAVDITTQGTGTQYLERSNRVALFYSILDLYDNQAAVLTIDPLTVQGQPPLDARVPLISFVDGTLQRITKYDLIDFAEAGESGEQELGNVLPNAVDGVYEIEEVIGGSSSNKFLLSPTNSILSSRTVTFDPRSTVSLQYSEIDYASHSLYDRAPILYNPDRQINVGQEAWISPSPFPAVDTFEKTFRNVSHGITEVEEATYVSETPAFPLENNTVYFLKDVNSTAFAVYETALDAENDENRIQLDNNGGANPLIGTGKFFVKSRITPLDGLENNTTYYVIRKSKNFISLADSVANAQSKSAIEIGDLGVAGESHTIQTFNVAAEVDGLGTVNTTLGSNIVTGTGTNFFNLFKIGDILKISVPRENAVASVPTQNGTTMAPGGTVTTSAAHGFITGQPVRYASATAASTLVSDFIYYVRVLTTTTFTLHQERADAIVSGGANAITFPVTPSGSGTFSTVYPGTVFEAKIEGIKTETSMIIDQVIPAVASDDSLTPIGTKTGLDYLIGSTLYVKGDGFSLHRPFDGGVELTPSLNPDSQVTRQTRKYFRYQSGKGLQVSFGINFNAPVQIDSMTVNSSGLATIKTRFANRVTPGLEITVVNVKDQLSQPVKVLSSSNTSVSEAQNALVFTSSHLYNNGLGVKYVSGATLGDLVSNTTYYVRRASFSPETAIELYTTLEGALLSSSSARVDLTGESTINATLTPENPWNGSYEIINVLDERSFQIQLSSQPPSSFAQGFGQYTPNSWNNSYLRAGMFDDQNGMYFEYDGNDLYVCRRSSTNQLSGTVSATFNSGAIEGVGTIFLSQLERNDKIVIRGQTYKVVNISANNLLHIQPPYSGESKSNIIVSKIEEVRIPQSEWNLDKADGNGPSGFNLDLTKMQMAYMDYSWYGAGKVRFGFKGITGDVNYFHEMVHNNKETEAYLRSGNLPTRYEVENVGTPSYAPTIAHWGTSVIMDGGFDDDKAYQFNAPSRTLSWVNNSDQQTFLGGIPTTPTNFVTQSVQLFDPDVNRKVTAWRILAATFTSVSSIRNNTEISGSNIPADTRTIGQPVASGNTNGIVYIDKQPTGTVAAGSTFNVGLSSDLLPPLIPLVSIRLGPAVDNGFVGKIGIRDIINRMQLALAEVGIIATHDVNVKLLLNSNLDNIEFSNVQKPSLSQLIRHNKGDIVSQGIEIYNFRVNGSSTTTASIANSISKELGDVFELGNSILGGDGTYPDGPDVLTVAVEPTDTSLITNATPFRVSASVTWTESQA
jgi:hypothetical protein